MKNIFKLFGIIVLAAIIVFSMAACGGGGGDDTPPLSAFAGTWNASNGRSIFISGDWFEYRVIADKPYQGHFSVSGSNITFTPDDSSAKSGKYTLSGNTFTLSNHTLDNTVNGTYTKVGDGGNTVVKTMTFEEFNGYWNEPGHETAHRWGYSYKDASNPFDLAGMYANNKAYFFTYSLTSDIDIDDFGSVFQNNDGDDWTMISNWSTVVWDCKKNTRYSSSSFFVPNADAAGTQSAKNFLEFYNKNRDVNNPATVSFYQFSLEQVEIADLNINVTADGSASSTTTQLTLTLAKAIPGLSADNITLSGVAGVTKGTLSGSGTTYTLPISGFSKGGTLNVGVEKSGYVFKNWLKTAAIYYKGSGSGGGEGDSDGTFDNLNGLQDWLNGKGNNTKNNPYKVKLNLGSLSGLKDFLKGSSGKYVNLDLSGGTFTGIGADAFKDLSNLIGITLPSGINSIGANAFNGCTNLISVTFRGTIPSGSFDSGAFSGLGDLRDKYLAGGAGTYTRQSDGTTWTKDGSGGGGTVTNGVLKVTDIPATYNGNWAYVYTDNDYIWGAETISASTQSGKGAKISNGSVSIPMWKLSGNSFSKYSGNDSLQVFVGIANQQNGSVESWSSNNIDNITIAAAVYTTKIGFKNGGATVSWNSANQKLPQPQGTSPTITTSSLPNGTVGTAYSQTLTATGGTPITWTIDSGTLPAGLSLSGTTGTISGTPTTAGTSTFTVKATNAAGSITKSLSITIAGGSSSGGGGEPTAWTKVANSQFGSTNIFGIAWGSNNSTVNRFVAGGESGKMAYSPDGVTWTAVGDSKFGTSAINSIAWGNNKFVAVGNGKMAYSTDGINWTAVEDIKFGTTQYDQIFGITWGNDKFVAVGSKGKIAYSPDGINWTLVTGSTTFSTSDYIYCIGWGNNKFVIGGNSGKMAYSSNGINWTAVGNSKFNTDAVGKIVWGNDKFVAVGQMGSAAYSSDGINWTSAYIPTSNYLEGLAWGNGNFVTGTNISGNGKMMYSSNGINWTSISDSKQTGVSAIAWGNNKFVAVGDKGTIAYSSGN